MLEGAPRSGGGHLVGGRSTIADLDVAAVPAWARPAREAFEATPGVTAWLESRLDRPLHKKVQPMR